MTSTQSTGNGRGVPPQVPSIPLSPELPPNQQDQSIGNLVRDASTHLSTLVRSEIELAKSELVAEVRKALRGSVYLLIALTTGLFTLFFVFRTLVAVLDIWLPTSASFGIIVGLMLATVVTFLLLARKRMRSIRKPERTINSLHDTMQLTKRNGDDD